MHPMTMTPEAPPAAAPMSMRDRLERYLNAFWLRPENALWMALRSDVLDDYAFDAPSLDLSCGDGLFSFLHAGGRLSDAFDAYTAVGHLDRVSREHADMYDHVEGSYQPAVVEAPRRRITTGTDLKPSLLTKAARLDFYDELVQADHNQPLDMQDGRYRTIFGNSIYWVQRIDAHLADLRRLAAPGATVLFQVKLDAVRDYTLHEHEAMLGAKWLELIGRGRFECWPATGDEAAWRLRFERAGFAVQDIVPFITRTHAHVWDIGLRPIAPLLVRMTNAIDPDTRLSIKRDWVALLLDLLEPMARRDFDLFGGVHPPAEALFVLTV